MLPPTAGRMGAGCTLVLSQRSRFLSLTLDTGWQMCDSIYMTNTEHDTTATRNLLHADSGEVIGEATAEQIAASDATDAQGGIILIDAEGAVVPDGGYGWFAATRVYVEGEVRP